MAVESTSSLSISPGNLAFGYRWSFEDNGSVFVSQCVEASSKIFVEAHSR